jgi:hypothetical protein
VSHAYLTHALPHNRYAAAKPCPWEVLPETSASTSRVPRVRLTLPQSSRDAEMEVDELQDDDWAPVSVYFIHFFHTSDPFSRAPSYLNLSL